MQHYNILLCGVGGTGIIGFGTLLKRAAEYEKNIMVVGNELRGRAQRGGATVNTVRYTIFEEHEPFDESLLKKQLESGNAYLIAEKQSSTSYALFKHNLKYGYKGLCITRTNPSIISKKYDLKDVELYWLTTAKGDKVFSPTDVMGIYNKINEFTSQLKALPSEPLLLIFICFAFDIASALLI